MPFRPSRETWIASLCVLALIATLGVMLTFVSPRYGYQQAGQLVTICYVLVYLAALGFIRRRRSFYAVGLTLKNCVLSILLGFVIGCVGLFRVTSFFARGTFVLPEMRVLTVLVATGLSVGFIEDLVFYGYFQFRLEEDFGAVVGILGTAIAWTAFHAVTLAEPGAGTIAGDIVGARVVLANLFATFLVTGVVVHLTRNIWAGVVQNALVGNVLTNLYLLSVRPTKVLIADPKALPVAISLVLIVVGGLVADYFILRVGADGPSGGNATEEALHKSI